MKKSILWLTILTALALVSNSTAFGQSVTGEVAGTVFDASGAGIPNANVVAKNEATNVETTTKSTTTGEYRLTNLPVGSYTITATASGFGKSEFRNVAITLNKVSTQN